MTADSRRRVALTILSLSLAFSLPALAQPTAGSASPPTANTDGDHGEWSNESFAHREFREEMAQIRKEYEEIEDANDQLAKQCANASGAQTDACAKERQALAGRRRKLHERTLALHEKMQAAHKQLREGDNPQQATHSRMATPALPSVAAAPARQ